MRSAWFVDASMTTAVTLSLAYTLATVSPSTAQVATSTGVDTLSPGSAVSESTVSESTTPDSMMPSMVPASVVAGTTATRADTLIPRSVLCRSALVPGWGQWRSGHRVKAILFAGAAAGWLSAIAVEHGRIGDAPTPRLHQDRVGRRNTKVLWYVITATAAAIDAYVDVHLDDFDVDEGFAVQSFDLQWSPSRQTARGLSAAVHLRF